MVKTHIAENGLHVVRLNGQIGVNQPGDICGFSEAEAQRLLTGRFPNGVTYAAPYFPAEKAAAPTLGATQPKK
jgi:hypothetical protein